MLSVESLNVYYGVVHALKDVSLRVEDGEMVALIGANGAGKTTLLRTVSGWIRPSSGKVTFGGQDITGASCSRVVKQGVAHCPEGRRVWPAMTVQENLILGAFNRSDRSGIKTDLERIYDQFPRLKERQRQLAGTLSGGEQQMLAIGRALMARPKLLLLDEPSLGLAPIIVQGVAGVVKDINQGGTAVLLVEQNAKLALYLAQRAYVLETGNVTLEGPTADLQNNDYVKEAYLGAGRARAQ